MPGFRIISLVIVYCVAAAALGAESQPLAEVVPVDGAPFKAQLQSLSADGMAVWQTRNGEVKKLALADLCWWGNPVDPGSQAELVLIDGSLIVADVTKLEKEKLAADWSLGGELKLPLDWVGGIVLAPPVDRQQADTLRTRLLGKITRDSPVHAEPPARPSTPSGEQGDAVDRPPSADSDWLILLNGDELGGEILAVDENAVKIRTAAGEVSVEKEKIAAMAFNPSLAAKPNAKDARLWIGCRDGSRLLASALTVDRGQAKIKLAIGVEVGVPVEKLVSIQPLAGRAVYLSDLKPAGYQHIPFLDLQWPYHADRNVLGSQLRAGGRLYLKGLGLHSAARLTFDLEKPFHMLAAEAAIDDQTAGRGSALFHVYIDDGSGKWQLKYESPIVRGGAAPVPISVDLTGAKRLSLLVDFADHGDEQAHADLLNARLQ